MTQPAAIVRCSALRDEADCRCLCGSLLARVIEGAVELKCRRCKRTLVVPISPDAHSKRGKPFQVIPVRETG
jgi:phage FluMu protein Com